MFEENTVALDETFGLPCPSCGSQLRYSAKAKKIICSYCGYEEELDRSNDKIIEQSLAQAASELQNYIPERVGKKVFDCQGCGAKFMVESDQVNVNCAFCSSKNVNQEAFEHRYIQPVGVIPFYISRAEAEKIFAKWIHKGFFTPSSLGKKAMLENMHGIYIPFWTYDAHTESNWRGQAGFYYYVTKTVRRNGKLVQKRVRKTRWVNRSGHLKHFFDDVLVIASERLAQKQVNGIMPYRLEEMVNYDPRLMVGWETEVYQVEVDAAYQKADITMDNRIRQMCSAQLGGDTQRNLRISTHKHSQTFKHIVLPLWLCSYRYQSKVYQFLINGQTGKVHGKKPLSWLKITLLVLLVAAIIVTIVLLTKEQ
ncbi:MAG: hypothetical protein MRY78_13820 [Saprospiraceae bacterium]|nr:hypothetical protein [Saprospiraceae bacterium]